METVNNIAKAAANAVWGENTTTGNTTGTTTSGTEPVSGQRGNTSAGEPYDKGNLEEPNSTTSTTGPSSTGDSTSGVGNSSVGGFSSGLPDRSATHGVPNTGSGSGTAEGSHGPHDSKIANAADPRVDSDRDGSSTVGNTGNTGNTGSHTSHHDTANFSKNTGTAAESDNVPDNKYTEKKAQDTPADTSKGQNDTRDPSDPQTNPKNNPTDVDDTTSGPNKGQELGPGPKPLIDVAKQHGGDAGNTTSTGDDKSKGKSAEDIDPNDPRAPSKSEGTGEKYIKSSGLASDGGDFDAANAGAGREADRLLEEKGIHRDPGAPPQSTGDDETTEKKSLKDKIKDKLHRH